MRSSTRSRAASAPTSSTVADGTPASGEDSLIARYFRPLATDPGAFNLDDDAAALRPSGDDIVVTTDAIVEGVRAFTGGRALNLLVNNAGVPLKIRADVLETTEESYDYILDTNLKGAFFLTQTFAREMVAAKKADADTRHALKRAYDEVQEEEEEHLYHSMGWARELWLKSLGIRAVLPPPEERKHVKTAIGAARAKQARTRMH